MLGGGKRVRHGEVFIRDAAEWLIGSLVNEVDRGSLAESGEINQDVIALGRANK
ncbi:MAG: hypothetical protein HYX84_06095 [Chloroflexi bacterium]|nr:hypothetical protein [Chloroflexota bacterium]